MDNWDEPSHGIRGYLSQFLNSGDATFQHIATWTLLQLLESEDSRLVNLIRKSDDVYQMIQTISDRDIESDDEDGEEGEAEVVTLARRCLELLNKTEKTLAEG